MKLLLDTSFIVSAFASNVHIMDEFTKFGVPSIYTIDLVIRELERLALGRGKDGRNARLAQAFMKQQKVRILPAKEVHTDRQIIRHAKKGGMTVCTMDKELKEKLLRRSIPVIIIRQKKYLVLAKKRGVEF